ncbi:amidohydrolase family protein [Pseudoalteromonas sp. ZZD1]|uniref:amidohydrolase family protein n=1 Tax=Pseudoalteromonas sp. ZZD1 TaxID=3139395 RepID=UPI003BAAFAEF
MSHTVIDSHHHFWQLSRGDYQWLTPALTQLYRDYLPEDYTQAASLHKPAQTVLVQAAATDAETDFMLALAKNSAVIGGVVGWIDWTLSEQQVCQRLSILCEQQKFKGVRPMLQDIEDVEWILNPAFAPIFKQLETRGLTFDALVKTEHLKSIKKIAQQYPQLNIVIDHCAKPDIANNEFQTWATALSTFKTCSNVYIKLSGLTTEATSEQTEVVNFIHYLQIVTEIFGSSRMMWGSDWPVVNINSSYTDWYSLTEQLTADWCAEDKQNLWSNTAKAFYKLVS